MATTFTYEAHPAAKMFPMLPESELNQLAEDIKQHGQLQPIILHEEAILDGRNRLEACLRAGVEPQFKHYNGEHGSPVLYVMALNLHRRQLTPSQKAAVAVEALP